MIGRIRLLRKLALLPVMLMFSATAAETLPDNVARRKLAELREIVESPPGRVDERVTTILLTADWPEDLMPTVRATLSTILQEPTAQLRSSAVKLFAQRNGEDAALLVPYLAASLPGSELADAVELLCAARSIGPPAHSLEEILRSKCDDSNAIAAIHAASALVRVSPTRRYPRDVLLIYLASNRSEYRWRAADAIARSATSDERWQKRLAELCRDDDVRVRVTSAYALWRITNDLEATLPVLVESLTDEDTVLATSFEYPSRRGDSHRIYALQAIMDMGDAAEAAMPHVLLLVKELASRKTRNSQPFAVLGIVALNAIRELGPVSESEFREIEASVDCRECAFAMVRDEAKGILSSIRRGKAKNSSETGAYRQPGFQ